MTPQSRWQRLRASTSPGGVLHALHAAASLVCALEPDADVSGRTYSLVLWRAADELVTAIDDLRAVLDLGDLVHEKSEIRIKNGA